MTQEYFVKDRNPGWSESETLEEWVIRMIQEKKQDTPEFKAALNFWGRDKFTQIWKAHKAKQKGSA